MQSLKRHRLRATHLFSGSLQRLHRSRPVRCDLLGPIQDIGQSVGSQHSLLEFSAASRNSLGAEELPQSCRQLSGIRLMIGECFSEVQFDDAMGVVGLIMRTRDDELRDTCCDALGCRSDPAMMHDGLAARE